MLCFCNTDSGKLRDYWSEAPRLQIAIQGNSMQ